MWRLQLKTSLVVIMALFSVIRGDRLMDNRLRRPFYVTSSASGAGGGGAGAGQELLSDLDGGNSFKSNPRLSKSSEVPYAEAYPWDGAKRNEFVCEERLFVSSSGVPASPGCNGDAEMKRASFAKTARDVDEGVRRSLEDIFAINRDPSDTGTASESAKGGGEPAAVLPALYYNDFYEDLMVEADKEDVKRAGSAPLIGCDCKLKNDLLDLGQHHFPRYLLNAVCQTEQSANEHPSKCWRGSFCKPLEYKVKVLTFRSLLDGAHQDAALAWLPDDLRQVWKFKTVTVAAGCLCSY